MLAVCAFSPLGGLIQRPVKSLGASPLTSVSFESSFAFSLPIYLFACISVVSKAHLCKSIVTAKPCILPLERTRLLYKTPSETMYHETSLALIHLSWPEVRQAAWERQRWIWVFTFFMLVCKWLSSPCLE